MVAEAPPLAAPTALLVSLALSFFFVASLHLWRLVGYEDKNRDETGTIKRRFVSTLFSCACGAALVWGLARPPAVHGRGDGGLTLLELLGLVSPEPFRASASCLAVTAALFLGPLAQHLLEVRDGYALLVSYPSEAQEGWMAARDKILAPVTEEFVFRACLVRLWDSAAFSQNFIIFAGPFCFALAHAHHFMEHIRKKENRKVAALQVAFQVFYTSLFGMYATYLLLRTGSTIAVILVHSFCNWQGFPDLGVLVDAEQLQHRRLALIVLYLVGIVAFCCLLVPLTGGFEPPMYRCMSAGRA